jgi:hypothetical protein
MKRPYFTNRGHAERECGLPKNDAGKSGMRGANLGGHIIQSRKSGGPCERGSSEILGNNETRHRWRHLAAWWHGKPKELTQGNCGSWQKLNAACRKMTHHAAMTWCRGHSHKGFDQVNVVPETRKGETFGKTCWKGPKCNNGIRIHGLTQQLWGSKQIRT